MTDEYMTPAEFAALPADAHHAVWQAHAQGRIDSVPAMPSSPNGMRCYHRRQVLALLGETAQSPAQSSELIRTGDRT